MNVQANFISTSSCCLVLAEKVGLVDTSADEMSTSMDLISQPKCSPMDVSKVCFNAKHRNADDDQMHMSNHMEKVFSVIFHALVSTLTPDINTSLVFSKGRGSNMLLSLLKTAIFLHQPLLLSSLGGSQHVDVEGRQLRTTQLFLKAYFLQLAHLALSGEV